MSIKMTKKCISFVIIFIMSVTLILICLFTNVSKNITPRDVIAMKILHLNPPDKPLTYDEEIALIQNIQLKVFKLAPMGLGIPPFQSREPMDLIRHRQGQCYDRSRMLDKALAYVGFETRHVYLLFKQNKNFICAILTKSHSSHAVTEVKTKKGWLFVDSNTAWIALDQNKNPVNADDVWKKKRELENIPWYLESPWWAIRGMYSRTGQFYPPYFPFPAFHWPTFIRWLLES